MSCEKTKSHKNIDVKNEQIDNINISNYNKEYVHAFLVTQRIYQANSYYDLNKVNKT